MVELKTDLRSPDTLVSVLHGAPRRLERYIATDEVWVRFSTEISDVPQGILPIPALTTLAPVAWVTNVEIHVEKLDSRFYTQLQRVREGYERLFPSVGFEGSGGIIPEELTEFSSMTTGNEAMLFSGGVDSIATYFRHETNSPDLYLIRGSDIGSKNDLGWDEAHNKISQFAEMMDTQVHSIESNFREWLDTELLYLHYRHRLGRGWWGAVQYQIALPGLCAPLAHVLGHGTLYEASGYTGDREYPTAQPYIVDELDWAGTDVTFDGDGLRRQDKIEIIADRVRKSDSNLFIRSCYKDEQGSNCCSCEKCWRTMVGLTVAGVNPGNLGFRFDEVKREEIIRTFKNRDIKLSELELQAWEEIYSRIDPSMHENSELGEFVRMISQVDLNNIPHEDDQSTLFSIGLCILRRTPYPIDKLGIRIGRKAFGI